MLFDSKEADHVYGVVMSWLRREAERDADLVEANIKEQFGLRVLDEIERQVAIEQKSVDGLSDPAWNAYESALTIIHSLREGR